MRLKPHLQAGDLNGYQKEGKWVFGYRNADLAGIMDLMDGVYRRSVLSDRPVMSLLAIDLQGYPMRKNSLVVIAVCGLLSAGFAYAEGGAGDKPAARDPDLPFVSGDHWTQSSQAERNAYLYGLGNMVELQQALVDDQQSIQKFNDVLVRGLSPMDLDQVKKALDDWYAAHPDDGKRPVLSVLYHEIALPLATRK